VIASDADDKSNNKLDTGTISFSDIENKADFDVSHVSVSVGTSGVTPPTLYQNSDSASSTTKSAVEQGELIIRDTENQQQDINQLSRDTENANDVLGQIFDKQKHLDNIEIIETVNEIRQQAETVMNNQTRLEIQQQALKDDPTLSGKALNDEIDRRFAEQNTTGMGGSMTKALDSVTSIISGALTGNITGGLAGAAAPHIASELKKLEESDPVAHKIAHGILGAVVAELQGGSGLAGGLGAAGGEIAAEVIRKELYGDIDKKDLTQEQREEINALAALAAGLAAAGVSGGDIYDAGTAVGGSKNAVENNSLSNGEAGMVDMLSCSLGIESACERAYPPPEKHFTAVAISAGFIGGYYIAAATPEMYAATQAALQGCKTNPMYCLNSAGIQVGEALTPGGTGAAGALVVGKTASEINAVKNAVNTNKNGVAGVIDDAAAAGKGSAVAQADKVAAQAQKDLLNEINSFTSKSQANKNATMVGAYDPVTGKTAIGNSNANITAETLHPKTVEYIEKQLGVKIGEFTSFCKNKAGACAEVSGADQLIRQGVAPERIKFTDAVRPRTVYEQGKITQDSIIKPCNNCQVTWPKDK
jgi:filamentous hemagglutinin